MAFILARFQGFLKKIILSGQSAYTKGRFIGEKVRMLFNIIEYCNQQDDPNMPLFLDFEKAFDSFNWDFVTGCF